jgi:hypothetical protein
MDDMLEKRVAAIEKALWEVHAFLEPAQHDAGASKCNVYGRLGYFLTQNPIAMADIAHCSIAHIEPLKYPS